MTTVDEYAGTIPGLLSAAASRDAGGTWLRSDSGSLTFGATAAAVGEEHVGGAVGAAPVDQAAAGRPAVLAESQLAVLVIGQQAVPAARPSQGPLAVIR